MINARLVPVVIYDDMEISNYYWETGRYGNSHNIYIDCLLPAVPNPGEHIELSLVNCDKVFADWKKILDWDEGDYDNPAKELIRSLRKGNTDYSAYSDEDLLRQCIYGDELDSILEEEWYVSSTKHTLYLPDRDYVVVYIEMKEPKENVLPKDFYMKLINILKDYV